MAEYGLNAGIAMGFQDSFGTQNVASLHFIPILNENVGIDQPPLISENMTGLFDEAADYAGPRTVGGDIATDAHPISLGMLISSVLGAPTSVVSDAIYTHTWKPRTADFDIFAANVPVTYYKDLGVGSAMLFYDLIGTVLELGITQGELTKANVTFAGGKQSQIAAIAKSLPTGKPRWPWDVASVSLGGVALPEALSATITIDEAIEPSHTLNASKFPSRVKRGGFRTVAVEGTLFFDNQNQYQDFLAETEQNLTISCKGQIEVQSGYSEDLNIIMPALRFRDLKPEVSGPTQIEVSYTAAAKYLQTSATAIEITLVNTLAGY